MINTGAMLGGMKSAKKLGEMERNSSSSGSSGSDSDRLLVRFHSGKLKLEIGYSMKFFYSRTSCKSFYKIESLQVEGHYIEGFYFDELKFERVNDDHIFELGEEIAIYIKYKKGTKPKEIPGQIKQTSLFAKLIGRA